MKIYCVSGLGADERVFDYLDLPEVDLCFIKWIKPLKSESLASYCSRLIDQIDLSQNIYLLGVSFGGIVCQEISKLITCKKIIIISSIKSRDEMSTQMKSVGSIGLHKILPNWLIKWSNLKSADHVFGTKTKQESLLLKNIIQDTDFDFSKWAIEEIINWKNNSTYPNLVHIHGTEDLIFPVKYIKHAILIKGGTHFMIVNRASEINKIILDNIV